MTTTANAIIQRLEQTRRLRLPPSQRRQAARPTPATRQTAPAVEADLAHQTRLATVRGDDMARDHGRIRWAIWSDPDWRALKAEEQRLFLLALTQPGLSYAGVVPYTLRRWQSLAADTTLSKLRRAVGALEAARFFVVDEDTEELLIRSFVRHDGLLDSPNICRAFTRDYAAVASPLLRAVLVCELWKLATEHPREGSPRSWTEVLEPWLNRTLPETFHEGFQQTLTTAQRQTLEAVEHQTLPLTISSARAAPTPAITPSPRSPGRGSANHYCDVHHQTEPCTGCAADRKVGTAGERP